MRESIEIVGSSIILSTFIYFLTILILIPAISAYTYSSWGYANSPLDYLENQWVMFSIYFIFNP